MSEPSTNPPADRSKTGRSKIGRQRRPPVPIALALVALVVIAGAIALVAIPGKTGEKLPGGAVTAPPGSGYEGTLTLPARAAPAIDLRSYLGRRVTLAQYRGKAVLVTFLYTNCPDVCPLIASNLRVALNKLAGQASKVQVIAVSVDPRGDTPAAVARFLKLHEMTGRMQYLIGSRGELARTWQAWDVSSGREADNPELVAHSALVYGVSAKGVLTTVYPASFEPGEIVHDVPRLAAG